MTKVIQILETIWYQDKKPPLILIVLSKIYGFLFKIRKALFSLGILSSTKPDIPVIVIGNLNIWMTLVIELHFMQKGIFTISNQ